MRVVAALLIREMEARFGSKPGGWLGGRSLKRLSLQAHWVLGMGLIKVL
jgi:hypothetical protein